MSVRVLDAIDTAVNTGLSGFATETWRNSCYPVVASLLPRSTCMPFVCYCFIIRDICGEMKVQWRYLARLVKLKLATFILFILLCCFDVCLFKYCFVCFKYCLNRISNRGLSLYIYIFFSSSDVSLFWKLELVFIMNLLIGSFR